MSIGRYITDEQKRQMRAMRTAGVPVRAIARALEVTPRAVWTHAPAGRNDVTEMEAARIRHLRYEDGLSAREVAGLVGRNECTIYQIAPGRPGKVPVAPLREAFLASPMTACDVARELGWWVRGGVANGARVKHTLGVIADNSHGIKSYRTLVDAETVRLIAEAIGISPWSVLPDDEDVAA